MLWDVWFTDLSNLTSAKIFTESTVQKKLMSVDYL